MAEDDYDLIQYKDISELKKELEGMKGRKDVSSKELYDGVQKLPQTISDMLEVFGAAAEQLKLEDKEREQEGKKHDAILYKLDKVLDQNKTIAEGMVSIVELVKKKLPLVQQEREAPMFKPKPEPKPFMKPQQEWMPEPIMPRPQPMPQSAPQQPPMPPPMNFGTMLPPLEPTPALDFDFPEEGETQSEEPKKKSLFGMFKK